MKRSRPNYTKGIKKYLILFVVCSIVMEALALYFPMLLQGVTQRVEAGMSIENILLYSGLVLGFIVVIFGAQFVTEYVGSLYADNYQGNIRKALYEKFSKLSGDQIDQIGVARILPIMMNDSNWLKNYNRRIISFIVYFPVAILGSFIMLFSLSWAYALFALASLPIVLVFFILNVRKLNKLIPASVDAYDEYFLNIKEGITGARDIRILGKAEERSADFEKYVRLQRKQDLYTDRALNMSVGFNAILFTIITIAIILFGTAFNLKPYEMGGIVVLNTAIQYINKIWAGSHQIFTWFVDYIPRCRLTVKRLDQLYAMPESPHDQGLDQIPTYNQHSLKLQSLGYTYSNGKVDFEGLDVEIPDGKAVAIAGGIGSGKSIIADLILKTREPSAGNIFFNDIDIAQINNSFWRRDILSFCSAAPKFIPGTIRENLQLLAPDITDERILKVFHDIGASDFVKKFDNFLDLKIKDSSVINDSVRNLLNIVRAILKPAEIYVFNQCFEHVKHSYITKMMAKMKRDKKTCLFITYDGAVCRSCDTIYVLRDGKVTGVGSHESLIKSNKDYRGLHSSEIGVLLYEEKVVDAQEIEADGAADISTVDIVQERPHEIKAEVRA